MFRMELPTHLTKKKSGLIIVGLPGSGKTSFACYADPIRYIDFDVKIGTFVKGDHAQYGRAANAIATMFYYFNSTRVEKRPIIATHIEVIEPYLMANLLRNGWTLVVCATAGDTAHVQSSVNSNIQRCITRGDSTEFIDDYRKHGVEWNSGTLEWLAEVHESLINLGARTPHDDDGSVCVVDNLVWSGDDPCWETTLDRRAIINMYHVSEQLGFNWFD